MKNFKTYDLAALATHPVSHEIDTLAASLYCLIKHAREEVAG